MANGNKDQNAVTSLMGVLNTTGASVVNITANPSTHGLNISDGTTGTDHGPLVALRDDNNRPTLIATSYLDGVTPVVIYSDSSGNLLVDSTTL